MTTTSLRIAALAGACVLALGASQALAQKQRLQSQLVVSGLQFPDWVGSAPGDPTRLFVVERSVNVGGVRKGRIRVINNINTTTPTLNPVPFWTSPEVANNLIEQGLIGLVFHPQYQENGYFWAIYSRASDWAWVLVRGRRGASPDLADATFMESVWVITHPGDNHYSGWMEFGADSHLYLSIGDGGGADDSMPPSGGTTGNAQDITNNKLGKIMRIDVDGWDNIPGNADDDGLPADPERLYRNPLDNPFFGISGDDEIWAYGLRNAWRCDIDPATGDLYVADVGQNLREEITILPPGQQPYNLGWRCYEGTRVTGLGGCDPLPNAIMPNLEYGHVDVIQPTGILGCAITGGVVYRGNAMPCLRGTYFFSDWCTGDIWSFRKSNTGAITELTDRRIELDPPGVATIDNVTSWGTDASGELYCVDEGGGQVFRILPNGYYGSFADCNNNARPDACDIEAGTSTDTNANGVPDECEQSACDPIDFNRDGLFPDTQDIDDFLAVFAGNPCPTAQCGDIDFNNDGLFPDTLDIDAMLRVFAGNPC